MHTYLKNRAIYRSLYGSVTLSGAKGLLVILRFFAALRMTTLRVTESRSRILLLAVVVSFLLVYVPTIGWLIKRWSLGVWYHSHGFLIPPVSVYLTWQILKRFPDRTPSQPSPYGFLLLIPALFLHVIDTAFGSYLLSSISLVLAVVGLSLLFLGSRRTRALWFPLIFLLLMIPIPLVATEGFRNILRDITAIASQELLGLAGVAVYREGILLFTTKGVVEIADACSGFSTLMAMLTIGSLYAYVSHSSPWWQRVLFVVISIPFAIIANTVRVFLLILLSLQFGFQILDTTAHPASGFVTFALAFFLLLAFDWGISKLVSANS